MNSTTRSSSHTHPSHTRPSRWSSLRDRMRARHNERALRDRLWRELEGYQSARELDDLLAAASRSEHPEADLKRW